MLYGIEDVDARDSAGMTVERLKRASNGRVHGAAYCSKLHVKLL
jgi:hypothetical protein